VQASSRGKACRGGLPVWGMNSFLGFPYLTFKGLTDIGHDVRTNAWLSSSLPVYRMNVRDYMKASFKPPCFPGRIIIIT